MGEHKKKKPKLIIAKNMEEVEAKLQSRELPEQNGDNPNMWIFEHAFPLADKMALPIKKIFDEYDDADPEEHSESEILIARTLALMMCICFMNFPVLETDNLEKAFATSKKMVKDYMDALSNIQRGN